MPSLKDVKAANSAFTPNYPPVAIFFGGTNGIGAGMAQAFARATNGNAHIILIGRNQNAAESLISKFPKPTALGAKHEFIQCDAMLMSNVHKTTTTILAKVSSINFIMMSPVFLETLGVTFTEEGLEKNLTLSIYSRWKLVCELLPALEKAVSLGQPATVYNVLGGAEISGRVDFENLGFGKKPTGMEERRTSAPSYTNMIMKHLAKEHPQISWVHAMPGFVNTGMFYHVKGSWWFWIVSGIFSIMTKLFASSPEDCGEHMTYAMLHVTPKATGLQFVAQKGDDANRQPKYNYTEEEGEKVWEHFVEAALHKV